jgi:hypothetical protein
MNLDIGLPENHMGINSVSWANFAVNQMTEIKIIMDENMFPWNNKKLK